MGLSSACVSADLEAPLVDAVCVDESVLIAPEDAVVLIGTWLTEDTYVNCAAMAIAPRLLLTSLTCVAVPANLERALEANLTLDMESCATPGGNPREDGSLAGRFSGRAEPRSVEVYFPPDAIEARLSVIDIAVSGSSTGCMDNLALLVLDESLPVAPVTLRLDDSTPAGEAVQVADLELIDGSFQPRATATHVEVPARVDAGLSRRRRALALEHPACDFGWGGGAFAEQTGALVGIMPPSIVGGCDVPDRPAVGLRLAPYRRMLLDAARKADATTLRVESTFGGAQVPLPPCTQEPR